MRIRPLSLISRGLLASVIGILLIAAPNAQVAFDSASSSATVSVPSTTLSWSHTTASDGDRAIVVGISFVDFGVNQNAPRPRTAATTMVTYGGMPLTFLASSQNGPSFVDLFGLAGASVPTGSNMVVVTVAQPSQIVGGAVSATGVDTSDPFNAAGGFSGSGTSFSMTLPGTSDTSLVVDTILFAVPFADIAPDPGQTERWDEFAGSGSHRGAGSTATAGDGTTTMTWQELPAAKNPELRGISTTWLGALVEIQAAPVSGPNIEVVPTMGEFTDGESVDFTISNEGSGGGATAIDLRGPGMITVTAVTIVGPDAAEFTLLAPPPPPLPIMLNAGDSFVATVQFNPVGPGPKTAFLEITSNAANTTVLQIPLNALGIVTGTVPTLSTWGLILMVGLLAIVGWSRLRRRQPDVG